MRPNVFRAIAFLLLATACGCMPLRPPSPSPSSGAQAGGSGSPEGPPAGRTAVAPGSGSRSGLRAPVSAAHRILPDYRREVLANGLVVLIAEKRELPMVSVGLFLRSGSTGDPEGKEGLASLTLELTRHGAGAHDAAAFDEAIESVGGSLSTTVDHDYSGVSAEFLSGDFAPGLGLLADLVQRPSFQPEEFERARAKALAELAQSLEDPSTVADRRFARFLFGSHPYGRPTEGTRTSLTGLTRGDVVSFHAKHFVPSNAVLAIVGDIDSRELLAKVQKLFGEWPARPAPRVAAPAPEQVRGRRVLIVDRPDVNQTQVRIGAVGISRSDADYFPSLVANTILGVPFTSWLNQEIREKRGLSYGARSSFRALHQPGPFVVSTFTRNDRLAETVEAAFDTLRRFRQGGYTEEDLRKAQNYRAGLFPLSLETSDQIAAALGELEIYSLPREFYDEQIDKVRSVTLEDLGRAGQRLFPVDDAVIVAVSPAASARAALEKFGPVSVEPLGMD